MDFYQKTTLDNGLRLLTARMPQTRSVSVSFFIGTGSRYEDDARAGLSHYLEHLCFKGTQQRPSAIDICSAIEGVGGLFNGGTDKELTVYWCKVAGAHLNMAIDVLVDMLLNSRCDPAEIEKERQVIIEEINMVEDNPAQKVHMLIDGLLWPGHPLGRDVAGTRQSVAGLTREMMLGYLSGHYRPGNTVVAIAGDIDHDDMRAVITGALGRWANREAPPAYQPYTGGYARRVLIEKKDTEQVQLCLALPGVSHFHPERFALDLLNVILGEGMSSRLFTQIRDKLGLAYSISSYADHFLDTGSLTVSAGVDVKNLRVAIRAILEEIGKLKDGVPEAELTKARELSKGRLILRMEDSRAVAGWIGGQEILTGRILSVEDVISIVDSITAEELRQLARDLLAGDRLCLAVVGPVSPDEPLEELLQL
ncbi:MAG: insulinase family protein [Chloroflexi bacterium]|nr:insulinase family protein [Chloroflexota bacterium]